MERNNYQEHTESLVRKITNEREKFVSAWQHGAKSGELNQIRENIQELNDLLWDASSGQDQFSDNKKAGRETGNLQARTIPNRSR
jgi:hypothetical protein